MAWFFSSEYKDAEQGEYYAPKIEMIPGELEKFEALGKALTKDLYERYEAEKVPMDSVDFPWWGGYKYPSIKEGWRWPMPDKPLRTRLAKQEGSIVDIISSGFGWGISDRVIDMIESIEPGVHQYLPLELVQPDGSIHPDRRWILNICTRAEVVDFERSHVQWMAPPGDHFFIDLPGEKHLVVKAEEAKRRALWFEWRYFHSGYKNMISDAFWEALQSAGVQGWALSRGYPHHIEEV